MNTDAQQYIESYLKTYGKQRIITVGEIHDKLSHNKIEYQDDSTGQLVRKIIKEIELKEHKLINPIYCIGSTSEGFMLCKNREQATASAKYLLTKFVSIAIRYQLRKNVMNILYPNDEFSTPLFKDQSPLPDFDIEKLQVIEKQAKGK